MDLVRKVSLQGVKSTVTRSLESQMAVVETKVQVLAAGAARPLDPVSPPLPFVGNTQSILFHPTNYQKKLCHPILQATPLYSEPRLYL